MARSQDMNESDDDENHESIASVGSDNGSDAESDNEIENDNNDEDESKNQESSSESDSGTDIGNSSDSDNDSNTDSDSDEEKTKDGISDYERLRLERIKRNQERLAALGLHDEALKPKPKKSHRRKSVERKVPLEPTRQQRSRSSKKRIDYSEQPKLVLSREQSSSLSSPKPPPRELTPEELAKREKRKKEKRQNERIPRFIYDEFQRIRSKRRIALKTANRLLTKAEREKNHWAKTSRKLAAKERKQEATRKKEALKQQKEKEARLVEQAERDELDCNGMTKKELLREIERRTPELLSILTGHDKEHSATLRKLQEEAKEKEELRKRESLERKMNVIDALNRYPKAMNEALTKLNALLYSRAPKDRLPARRSVRRKHDVAFCSAPNYNGTASTAKGQKTRKKQKLATTSAIDSTVSAITKVHNDGETREIDSTMHGTVTPNSNSLQKKNKKRGSSSMELPAHPHAILSQNNLTNVSTSLGLVPESHKNSKHKHGKSNTTKEIPPSSAKKQRKPKDARFVGGWISPMFSKELDRSWLERTKPIDNRPVVLVPDDVAKLAGISSKKTAVFDLASYVPQVGDIILYYPSAHKDVLKTHPDTLGSRQRNLLRVPLWARANRDRNRFNKEGKTGTIWWTDEWIESLLESRNKSKKEKLTEGKMGADAHRSKGALTDIEPANRNVECTSNITINNLSLGDYPIICRVEKTHAEFPEDPYAKEALPKGMNGNVNRNGNGANDTTDMTDTTSATGSTGMKGKRLSFLASTKINKKRSKIPPQVRLAVALKPLSPIVAPNENSGLNDDCRLGLAPTFTVVSFPVAAPLEPFIIPFCWAYTSFHSLSANETIWIRRSSSVEENTKGRKSDIGLCGKGKIVEFFAPKSTSVASRSANMGKEGAEKEGMISSTPAAPILDARKDCTRLRGNIYELSLLLASLTENGAIQPQSIIASLASEKNYKGAIPIREANIIVEFLGKYMEHFEHTSSTTSTRVETASSPPSLVSLILKTLPLRRGVLVAYDLNKRQLHRASPWNLVTIQPTELSRSVQTGLLPSLENSLREKAILCIESLIDNNSHAHLFVPMVTELIAPGYYSAVPVGMSLGRVLARLKTYGNTESCYYTSLESILMDLNLISENCLLYNNPESVLVAYCREIISECQTLIKAIIQNRSSKDARKVSKNDSCGKKQTPTIPSLLNAPFKGKCNWEWLQQITPFGVSDDGETVTRRATSSTWIPQCGESIFYSIFNHSRFVRNNRDFLDDLQCSVPVFRSKIIEAKTEISDEKPSEIIGDYDLFSMSSSHWLEGTVISVRSSFPKARRRKNEDPMTAVTPILIIELRLHYTQCESNVFVCWRPIFDGNKYRGSGLAHDSFLRPGWICTDEMEILPSNNLQAGPNSTISEEMRSSITKCLDFLKQRCIDGISPEAVNAELALENVESGTPTNFEPHSLPSYVEFFAPAEMKYGTRRIQRLGYKSALKTLSKVGYMPLWSIEGQQDYKECNEYNYESWMPFPSLCLELIRLRIASGYYKDLRSVVNDISESYVCTVLFLLSGLWTRNPDRVSIRKIAKYLMSLRGNGKMSKISIKKSKKKKNGSQSVKSQHTTPFKKKSTAKAPQIDKLSEEEEILTRHIFQIRRYHAAAIVFALETSNVEKIFCLESTTVSDCEPDELPEIEALRTANYTPYQLEGVVKIRRLLQAIRRDPCRNRSKISYRDSYKLKIRCGGKLITENGQMEITNDESIFFEPAIMTAILPNGKVLKVGVKCRDQDVFGDKKVFEDRIITGTLPADIHASDSSSPTSDSNNVHDASCVGQSCVVFNSADFKNKDELVRTLFGTSDRLQRCVRCQSNGGSLFSCRVLRQHSNPDYDLVKNFKGTSGVESLLIPWKEDAEVSNEVMSLESSKQQGSNPAIDNDEESKGKDAAQKEEEEKNLAATLSKKKSEAIENLERAVQAFELASYLQGQALYISHLEVKLSDDFIIKNFPIDPIDNHYMFCIHCGCAGDLLVCDGCPNVSHPKCADLIDVPEGDWFCHKCAARKKSSSHEATNEGEGPVQSENKCIGDKSRTEIYGSLKNCGTTHLDNNEQLADFAPKKMKSVEEIKAKGCDTQRTTENENNPMESSAAVNPDGIEHQPEIDDEEFRAKQSELEKLVNVLINKRFPPKIQTVEEPKQKCKALDALGNSYVRDFLSFIEIESAEELLSTKSSLIAKDLKLWRHVKGMKPLSDNSCSSAVSMWKNVVRKASSKASKQTRDNHTGNNEPIASNEERTSFKILPSQGRRFCSYLGITDAEVFLQTRSSELAKKYAAWRKKEKMSELVGTGTSAYIATWKAKLRQSIASPVVQGDGKHNRVVPKGYKVRKLFDDGNYYDGEVISGPNEAFDEEKGENVLCWKVKYIDDDEEEFTIEELDHWGIGKYNDEKDKNVNTEIRPEVNESFNHDDHASVASTGSVQNSSSTRKSREENKMDGTKYRHSTEKTQRNRHSKKQNVLGGPYEVKLPSQRRKNRKRPSHPPNL